MSRFDWATQIACRVLSCARWSTAEALQGNPPGALSAAGFFTQRGIKLFGRAFVFAGSALVLVSPETPGDMTVAAHYVMGFFFGVLHLAYGSYLYFTERQRRP